MHGLVLTFLIVFSVLGVKELIGLHFPWELVVKRRKRLTDTLERIKSLIPSEVYVQMGEDIERIN